VFDEVYILFHFNILLTTGCPLLKKSTEIGSEFHCAYLDVTI